MVSCITKYYIIVYLNTSPNRNSIHSGSINSDNKEIAANLQLCTATLHRWYSNKLAQRCCRWSEKNVEEPPHPVPIISKEYDHIEQIAVWTKMEKARQLFRSMTNFSMFSFVKKTNIFHNIQQRLSVVSQTIYSADTSVCRRSGELRSAFSLLHLSGPLLSSPPFFLHFLAVENTLSLVLKHALTVGPRILISRDKTVNQKGCLVYSLLIGVH